jgi:membrane peptidoglycan carboxypeptidase
VGHSLSRLPKFAVSLATTVVVAAVAVGGCIALLIPTAQQLTKGTTTYGELATEFGAAPQNSYVFDRNGDTMAVLFAEEDRDPVSLDEVPRSLINAVIAIEDRNFWHHHGIDLKGVARALFRNTKEGEVVQGGSTVTQQLVKIGLINDTERTVQRKTREAVLAWRLEKELTKRQILERYLNLVYFGSGAYGVRAASERYFEKEPRDLGLSEAALLAGLISNPEGNNPINFPERAKRRRKEVLDAMVKERYARPAQAKFANAAPLPDTVHAFSQRKPKPDTFFVEEVKRRLLRDPRLGATYQERYNRLFRGGLRIYTGFDPKMQVYAEAAVRDTVPQGPFTAALVSLDNATGEVRAMYGGASFRADQFNLATQSIRQTGSAFKPVTLATALDAGYSPEDGVAAGSTCTFPIPGGPPWVIQAGEGGGGYMNLRNATVHSVNCAYARLALSVGPKRIVDMAERLGINTSKMQAVPSITLGTQSTPMLDMATAYSVFANDGVRRDPVFVVRVEDADGQTLFAEDEIGQQVLDQNIARTEVDVLKGVIASGTGTRARLADGRVAFGKTGTTNDLVDALFIGATPQLTTAVWMGNPKELQPMRNVGQFSQVFGGTFPALIWKSYMDHALAGEPLLDFPSPDKSKWPRPGRVDEKGGRIAGNRAPSGGSTPGGGGPPPTVVEVPLTQAPTPTSAPGGGDGGPGPVDGVPPTTTRRCFLGICGNR